jgi:hypothetical protein
MPKMAVICGKIFVLNYSTREAFIGLTQKVEKSENWLKSTGQKPKGSRHAAANNWHGDLLKDDKHWKYGMPPASNANFAWVQYFIHHLAPTGFVLANGSMSSNQSGEGEIRYLRSMQY